MTKIVYVEHDGTSHAVDLSLGVSLMKGAVKNNIPGIDGNCGGSCICGTCHVYVDDEWADKAAPLSVAEEAILKFVNNKRSNSRLSCQIAVSDRLEGLVVHIPASQ